MKKITLLLTLVLAGSSMASAESTPISTLPTAEENQALYTISARDARRGVLYADVDNGKLATAGSTYNMAGYNTFGSVVIDDSSDRQQYAIISYDGDYYLYSPAAHKLCVNGNPSGAQPIVLSDVKAAKITFEETPNFAGFYNIMFGGIRMSFSNGSQHYGACRLDNNGDNDDGARMKISKITGVTLSDEEYVNALKIIMTASLAEVPATAGYPSEAARTTYTSALDAATTVDALNAAKTAFVASTDVILPEDGHAYRIKAKFNGGDAPYRYIGWDAAVSRLNVATEAFADDCGTFYVKKHDDGTTALFNCGNRQFLCYFSDSMNDLNGNKDGFTADFLNDDKEAVLTFGHWISSPVTPEQAFGTLYIQGKNAFNYDFYLMAGDVTFHNGAQTLMLFSNNRSSFFEFEEFEVPLSAVTMSELDITNVGNKVAACVAPYAAVVPAGVKAYFVSEANMSSTPSRADEGAVLVLKTLAESGAAIAANTPVILAGEAEEDLRLEPATREQVATVPDGFTNLLQVAAANDDTAVSGHAFNGSGFAYSDNIPEGSVYVPDLDAATSYSLDGSSVSTSISEIGANVESSCIYDLQGRRLNAPVRGINIINGQKVLVK